MQINCISQSDRTPQLFACFATVYKNYIIVHVGLLTSVLHRPKLLPPSSKALLVVDRLSAAVDSGLELAAASTGILFIIFLLAANF